MPDKLEQWLLDNPLFGVLLMALLGGAVAHVKYVAKHLPPDLSPERYLRFAIWCTIGFIGRIISAMLGGLFVLFFWKASGWKWEYGFLAAGMFGLFSSEAFDWIWIIGRAKLQKLLGITDAEAQAQNALLPKDEQKP